MTAEPESLLDVHAGRLYTRAAAARLLGYSPSGITKLCKAGKLRCGTSSRILGAELIRFAGAEEARAEAKSRPQYESVAAMRRRYQAAEREAKLLVKEGV